MVRERILGFVEICERFFETPFRKEKIGHLLERGNRILAALSFTDESDSLFLNRKGLFEGRAGIEHRPRLTSQAIFIHDSGNRIVARAATSRECSRQ